MSTTAAAAQRGASRARGRSRGERIDHTIMGVPARIMRPRLIVIVTVFVLTVFGLLMIYSASSIEALSAKGDAAYYLKRQAVFAAFGLICAIAIASVDYRTFAKKLIKPIWVLTVLLLLATAALGFASHGAVRWVSIAGVSIQPSEFAKLTVILTAANLLERYTDDPTLDLNRFFLIAGAGIGIPLLLIVAQPDKGTTLILACTLVVMAYLSGAVRGKTIAVALGGVAVVGLALVLRDDYSRARLLTALDPWADPYGDGYQLIQGFYAFGSGGLFGVGIGFSRQKYSYLPEAHNDFIFAIVGEELGLVGTLAVVALFALLVWECFKIARNAPDLTGKLVAAGSSSLIAIQFLVNVLGVLGITPLTGKPLPFLSYGGSSIMSCLMIMGLVISVSRASRLPETAHDERRRTMQVVAGREARDDGDGEVRVLHRGDPSTPNAPTRPAGLRVVDGGRDHPKGRTTTTRDGRTRIDLGPTASDRLRSGSSTPLVRGGRGGDGGPRNASGTGSGTRGRGRGSDR